MGCWTNSVTLGKLIYLYYGYASKPEDGNWQPLPWVNRSREFYHEAKIDATYSYVFDDPFFFEICFVAHIDSPCGRDGKALIMDSIHCLAPLDPEHQSLVYRVGFVGKDGKVYETHVQHQ